MFKRFMSVLTSCAMFCAGAVLVSSPAHAAGTQFAIMLTGSRIPAYAKSVQLDFLDGTFRCVKGFKAGQDFNTGVVRVVRDGSAPGSQERQIWVVTFDNDRCGYPAVGGGTYQEAPQAATSGVNKWWINLS
ncbi:hypothetical protein JNUCC0626_47860 [Lentzea sp. JNUCC 0626]|uniref:hypothetical protein n=1 Tax=Lentzea sp. JNUCC 0626 TaxID=3367513 RepID=UPI003748FE90